MEQIYAALVTGKTDSIHIGTLPGKLSDLRVAKDVSWKLLALAAAPAATHALVKMPERKDEKLSRLSVTDKQRKQLLQSVERSFGDSIKGGVKAGQESVVAAAALIYQFLSDPKWKSLDSR